MDKDFDCMSCGRCCFGEGNYVQVFAPDAVRLGAARTAEYVATPVGEIQASVGRDAEPERFMRMSQGRCAALRSAGANCFSCAVYEDRPTLCRALEPGSAPCLEARARWEPIVSAAEGPSPA